MFSLLTLAWPQPAQANTIRATWPPGSTLYGAAFRNGVFNTICSVTITNWSDFSTDVTVTPNGYSPVTQTIPAKNSRVWNATIIPSGVETWVTAQSNNGASLTGTIRCRATDSALDSLAVDEMIPASGPATIPFIPSTGGGYFVGSPQSGTAYRITDGATLGAVSGYSWGKPGADEGYVRGNAAQVMRGNGTTAGGARAAMTAMPDAYAGRTVVFPRVFKSASLFQGSLVNLVNVGTSSATVSFTAYEQGTSNTATYGPVVLPANGAVRVRIPDDWNPPFEAMSVVAEAQGSGAQLSGSVVTYRGASTWTPASVTFMDLAAGMSGQRAFATLARATFRRQIPSGEGTAVVIMNTSAHNNVPVRVVLRNSAGTALLNNVYTLGAFRRQAIQLTDDTTFPTGEYSVEAYPDTVTGTVAMMVVGYETLTGQMGAWAISASVVSFDQTGPAAFNKISPSTGAATPSSVTLQWGASSDSGSGLARYEYCVDATINNTCDTTWTSVGTATSVALSGLAAGAREWQVRAVDNAGNLTNANAGAWWTFTVYAPPGAFNKTAPANGATGQPTNPTLTWGTASGTVNHYRYCNSTTSGCTPATSVGTNTSVALSGLTPGTTYYWQARACADVGCTVFTDANSGAQWSYTVAATPGAFNKTAPANGATGQPTNPTLTWGAASGTVNHYRYCNSTTSGCTPATSVGTATSVTLSGLTPGTMYYWQVRACADAGCTVFTDANSGAQWSYTIVAPPGVFSKSAPANGATGQPTNPTLTWGAASGTVNHYRYCNSTTSGCTPATSVGTATSVALSGLTPGTTYYWQVRACADAGCTVFTDANSGTQWSYTVAAAVGAFNKVAPGNSAVNVNTSTAQLQWGAASGATAYGVCLGTAVNTCNVLGGGAGVYSSTAGTTLPLSGLGLQPNTTYYWQALATNGTYTTFADGSALAFWSFTTLPNGPAGFGKLSPPHNATNVPTQSVTFQWQPATGALSYTVCVGAFAGDCSYTVTSTGTSAALAVPLPAGATLVWQVTAHNAGGSTGADNSAWWPFTTAPNAPQVFSKLNPPDTATDQALGLSLTWQDAVGESQYQVCAGTGIGLCNLLSGTVAANTTFTTLTGLTYGTQYWWQVSACNTGGCTPANNGVFWGFRTLNPPAPGPFRKTAPVDGATHQPVDPALTWTASTNANGYEVCLGTQPGTCDLSGGGFQDVGNVTARLISQLPFSVTLQPASTYWWQVRAYNTLTATRAFADGGVDFHFTTANLSGPGEFSKDAPVNATFNVPTAGVTLRWFVAAGVQSYEICVGTAANACNALAGNAWLNVGSALTATVTNLQPGTTYFWQVRALNAGGQTQANGGVWWTFTTRNAEPPAEFSKAAPAHTSIGVPTATAVLSWFVSTGALGYDVCLGSAPGRCDISGDWVDVGNATSWTPPALQAGRTHWWQARARGSGFSVQADGGQWWAFTTANNTLTGPGAFQKTSPLSGTVVGSDLTLVWTASSGAAGYRVCVGTAWGLCDVANNAPTTALSHTLSGLQPGSYWWQITAVDAGDNTTQADGGARWVFTAQDDGIANLDTIDTRKEAQPAAVRMGELVTYTIVLSNSGAVSVTARVTDTLAVSATLESATPGYAQSGQTLSWSNVVVPANGTATITITVRAGSGPLPAGYTLNNSVTIGARDGTITRDDAPGVQVGPWRAYAPIVLSP